MNASKSPKGEIVPKGNSDINKVTSNLIRRGLDEFRIESKHNKIRVLYVDNSDYLTNYIHKFAKDLEIVNFTTFGLNAINLYKELKPDILVSGTHISEIPGIELAMEVRKIDPKAKILFLSISNFLYFIRRSIKLGAKGFFGVPPIGDDFINAIREIHINNNQDLFYFDDFSVLYSLYGDFLPNVQIKRLHGACSISNGALIQINHKKFNSYNSPYYRSTSSLILNDIEFLDLNDNRIKEIDFSMIKQMKNLRQLILPPGVLSPTEISWLRSKQGILLSIGNVNIRRVLYPGIYEKESA